MADQEWLFREFAAPDGAQQAVQFLNEADRQGAGEASVTLRNDGSAAVIYLALGSLGTSTSPTWVATAFTAPNGAADAAQFLNENARQGQGEASATLRNDGSAGLIYLEPGSLGANSSPTWVATAFGGPSGAQDVANFLNENARQGAGEASVTPRSDGSAGLIYLEPGSLGANSSPTWFTAEFSGPSGAQAAVDFLNESPRQGPGEAVGFIRNDGSAAIFYLEP